MKVLYVATDQTVPGTLGGSVHVTAVAEGLAALGHEVHVLVGPGDDPFPEGPVDWCPLSPPLGSVHLRLLGARRVGAFARRVQPDVVIERYHNFGGEGVLAARAVGAPAVLEVNAPVVDHTGSVKRRLDRLLLVEPMRRWREWQCAAADLIVTPHAGILPSGVPADRVLEIEWGADTTRFRPDVSGPAPFTRRDDEVVVVFAGAFRVWHGAIRLVDAVRRLRARGRADVRAVLVGDGPERARVMAAAGGLDGVTFTGPVPYARMPACLAAADIGVAPFDLAAHRPLTLGFYWSPLKVFEYMAAGLPVVAPRIDRLESIVRSGREGVLYEPARPDGLADAIDHLRDPSARAPLGTAARERVVARFGWDRHCRALAEAMERVARDTPGT